MEIIKLEATIRDGEESAKQLITNGFVSAILYGAHMKKNENIKIKSIDIEKALKKAGESTLIDLFIDGKESGKVLIKDYQKNPIKDNLIHVDFYAVDMKKEINTTIPLNFIGESKAIKELGGVLMKGINEIEVKCLPGDLVNHIDVDITPLETFENIIRLTDVNLPEKITLTNKSNATVANVVPPRKEEEEEMASTEGTTEEEKKEGEGKKEGEEEKKEEKTEEKK